MDKTAYGNNGRMVGTVWTMDAKNDSIPGNLGEACGNDAFYLISMSKISSIDFIGFCTTIEGCPAKWEVHYSGELKTILEENISSFVCKIHKNDNPTIQNKKICTPMENDCFIIEEEATGRYKYIDLKLSSGDCEIKQLRLTIYENGDWIANGVGYDHGTFWGDTFNVIHSVYGGSLFIADCSWSQDIGLGRDYEIHHTGHVDRFREHFNEISNIRTRLQCG